jgi:hypothetical protein
MDNNRKLIVIDTIDSYSAPIGLYLRNAIGTNGTNN